MFLVKRGGHAKRAAEAAHHVDRADVGVFLWPVHRAAKAQHDASRGLHQIVVADVIGAHAAPHAAEAVKLAKQRLWVDAAQAFGV